MQVINDISEYAIKVFLNINLVVKIMSLDTFLVIYTNTPPFIRICISVSNQSFVHFEKINFVGIPTPVEKYAFNNIDELFALIDYIAYTLKPYKLY